MSTEQAPSAKTRTWYRVAWVSGITGASGHGNWFEDYAMVDAIVKQANKDWPMLGHWVDTMHEGQFADGVAEQMVREKKP